MTDQRPTWYGKARERLRGKREIDIPVGGDLHLLEMALAERTKLVDALRNISNAVETGEDNALRVDVRELMRPVRDAVLKSARRRVSTSPSGSEGTDR